MRKRVLPIPLLALSFVFASNSFAAPPNVASLDWSVKAPHNLAASPPPDDVIKSFMSELHDLPGYPIGICYARFADLRRSGTLSLVVSESDGRFCHIIAVDKIAGGFTMYAFNLAHFADVPEIKDLGRDGNLELIVPTDFTGYYGAQHCMAQWPVIYAWTGSNYSDVSSHYKGYYEQQLASLQKEIASTEAQNERAEQASAAHGAGPAASAAGLMLKWHLAASAENKNEPVDGGSRVVEPQTEDYYGPGIHASSRTVMPPPPPQVLAPPPPGRDGLDCTKAEAAKIERFLGISRDAGMTDAIKWKNSDNPYDRQFAAWVLADIATPEAISDLQVLRHEPNRGVAMAGKHALDHVSKGPEVCIQSIRSRSLRRASRANDR